MTEDERRALMDRNLAAARARVEAADDADRAPDAKALTRTEVVRAWCVDKPVALKVNGSWLHAMIDARSVECWRPDCDSDSSAHCAGEIIDRIAQALAADDAARAPEAVNVSRLTPTVISPACNCDDLIAARETIARQKRVLAAQFGLDDNVPFSDIVASIRAQWHLDQETIARLTNDCESLRDYADRCSFASGVYYECDAPARGPIDDVERAICDTARECDSLRAQLATVTLERDELRTSLDLAAQAVALAHGTRGSK